MWQKRRKDDRWTLWGLVPQQCRGDLPRRRVPEADGSGQAFSKLNYLYVWSQRRWVWHLGSACSSSWGGMDPGHQEQ